MTSLTKICLHWTAGANKPCNVDLNSYHFVFDKDGKEYAGKYKPEDNLNCYDGKYAKHCGGGNTGSIGIAMACMFGFRDSNNVGNYPMTSVQFEACTKKVAELCREYNILITPDTVLTHYEFGQKHPKTTSFGKIDIVYLPPFSHVRKEDVGDFIRNKVKWYLGRIR